MAEIKFIYYSNVKDAHLQPTVRQRINLDLKRFEGKRVEVSIKIQRSKRSEQQNRYYWVCVGILADELALTKDETHEILKYKFLKRTLIIGDEEVVVTDSTASLNKSQFGEFVDNMKMWASMNLGIVIPDPNTQIDMTLE